MFSAAQNQVKASLFLVAAEFACDFLAIPRLLSAYLLERGGYHFTRLYPLDQVVIDSRADYYRALSSSQRNWHTNREDLTPWINFFVGAVFEQWERGRRRLETQGDSRRQEAIEAVAALALAHPKSHDQ